MAFAQTSNIEEKINLAKTHFSKGEYNQAIVIYDEILENDPNNILVLKMKGIVHSNQGYHTKSLEQFYKILQESPKDVTALTGMGVGFGYLGEYNESQKYFEKAIKERPNNTVIKNYKEFIDKVITKYPYAPTTKPIGLEKEYITEIPEWVKQIAKWWSQEQLKDSEFISAIIHLINNKIIQIPPVEVSNVTSEKIPEWVKNNAGWWADGAIDDDSFVQGIQFLVENGMIIIDSKEVSKKSQVELDHEFYLFKKYLRDISKNILKETRYIEYPNPSQDVIKKFLRDVAKWNFTEQVEISSNSFPDPTFEKTDEGFTIFYKIFINDQPYGLPLDHVGTLQESSSFWENNQELKTNDEEVKIEFDFTTQKSIANVWVTWVVRDLGQSVLGHAHLGKGVVEVALGDYNCDGSFQLYDVESVKTIMTHELGHSIGLKHVNEKESIMYPSFTPHYAYCLATVN